MSLHGGYKKRVAGRGEEKAARMLEEKGYRILERNYRAQRGEIDIIAMENETVVFVEVKTKVHDGFGEPEDWVDSRKQAQLGKVAMGYLMDKQLEGVDCRFDVVTVTDHGNRWQIRHIVDAFWIDPEAGEEWQG